MVKLVKKFRNLKVKKKSMMKFDEGSHTYTSVDGVKMPSVTQVLPDIPDEIMYTRNFIEKTALGTRVHKVCHYINAGYDYGELEIRSKDIPYIQGWKNFLKEITNFSIIDAEQLVYSLKYGFAGTLDVIGSIDDKKTILDIKTSSKISPTVSLQLAGYCVAYNEMFPDDKVYNRMCVQLLPNGRYKIYKYPVKEFQYDKSVYLSKLLSHKWDVKNKIKE